MQGLQVHGLCPLKYNSKNERGNDSFPFQNRWKRVDNNGITYHKFFPHILSIISNKKGKSRINPGGFAKDEIFEEMREK